MPPPPDLMYSNNATFTVGIGVTYETNFNQIRSTPNRDDITGVEIGHRAPDAPVFRPGTAFPKPLRLMCDVYGS